MVTVTSRAQNIEYAIRDVIPYTTHLVKDGRKIYYLNIGDPAAFDFRMPQNVKDALCAAVQRMIIIIRLRREDLTFEKQSLEKRKKSIMLTLRRITC